MESDKKQPLLPCYQTAPGQGDTLRPHLQLEDGGSSPIKSQAQERHDAALAGIERRVKSLSFQMNIFAIIFISIAASLLWACYYDHLPPDQQQQAYHVALQVSIPVVALFFTWLGTLTLILTTAPAGYKSPEVSYLARHPNDVPPLEVPGHLAVSPCDGKLKGVVPRKCTKMARTAFKCARPYLMGPRDWFKRVDTDVLFSKMHPMLERVVRATINSVSKRHFPSILVNSRLPSNVEEELVTLAMEQVEAEKCQAVCW
eukprot:symbB.v1.2.024910.t1/scaffold2390.1/size80330/9